jgi:pimeloyl-ACP methyl ester carboxylesterase
MTALLANAEYAKVDGHRVYYEVTGSGEPAVVLIHGWTCDSTFWRMQTPEFAKSFRVLALDLPGHGRSDKPDVTYDLKLFSRGVLAAMDAAKVPRAVLVTHSMGTSVARQVIADAPKRVAALLTVDGSVIRNPPESLLAKVKEWSSTMKGSGGPAVRRQFIEGMFSAATTPEVRKHILDGMLATPEHVAASAMEQSVGSAIWNGNERVDIPVMAVNQKRNSQRTRPAHQEVFANLEYVEMEGAGHFLHMERPAEFNKIAIDFIRKSGAR